MPDEDGNPTEEEIDEAMSDTEWLMELEAELEELERTDPAVGAARDQLDATIRDLGRPPQ